MAFNQPTASEIRTAKGQAVGGGRKRCRKGKNCSAACIQAGMACLVEMPESAGVSLSKVSSFLQKRSGSPDAGQIFAKNMQQGRLPSVPSDMKREIAALAPRQLERSPGAQTRTPQKIAAELNPNPLAAWGVDQLKNQRSAAYKLGRDDKVKEIDAELQRRGVKEGSLTKLMQKIEDRARDKQDDALDVKAKTVSKIAEAKKPWSATGNTKWAREDAEDFDTDLSSGKLRRVGEKTYSGWTDSYGSGSRSIGEGAFGSVIKNKDGTYIKRGAISETEADLIKELGKKGIGPKLIAADVNGKHDWHEENFVNIRKGRIAMSGVPGAPMGDVNSFARVGGMQVPDIYWKALGELHKLGIAHNDAHIDNILVDNKGKGRWVDLGLAQKSPKAALAEALGSFAGGDPGFKEGNWQTRRWNATGIKDWEGHQRSGGSAREFKEEFPVLGKVVENRAKVFNQLRDYGLTTSDYAKMTATPIRSPLSVYDEGSWAKLTDAQAQNLINILYDGI
jgi:hypothetical protein